MSAADEARAYLSVEPKPKWFNRDHVAQLLAEHDGQRDRADRAEAELATITEDMSREEVQLRLATLTEHDIVKMWQNMRQMRTQLDWLHGRAEKAEAVVAQLQARLAAANDESDLSGWSAAENAEFEKLYGVQAAMRLRAAHDRVWAIVQELRSEAVKDGRDPYEDPMARRLAAALVGTDSGQPGDAGDGA